MSEKRGKAESGGGVVAYIYWEEDGAWLGYLQDFPDYWTQGETLDDLKEHLRDLYANLTGAARRRGRWRVERVMWQAVVSGLIGAAGTIIAAWLTARWARQSAHAGAAAPTADVPRTRSGSSPGHAPSTISGVGSTLAADRAAFLQEVETIVGEQRRAEYERVLDDLIAWSESQGGRIEFRPRPQGNQQATVTYCFRGTPHLFWQVYPRPSRRDAKLTSVLDPRWLVPDPLRETLLRQFAELSGGQPDSPVLPTLSFNDLLTPTARQRLFVLLGDVLTTLSARLQTSPPGDSQPGNE